MQADELQSNLVAQTRATQLANAEKDNALVKCAPFSWCNIFRVEGLKILKFD